MKVLATVRSYQDLHAAMRARCDTLRLRGEAMDEMCKTLTPNRKFPDRYAMKLLAPVPDKGIGPRTLGPMLAVLGLKLLVVEDLDAVKRITSHLERHKNASGAMRTMRKGRRYRKLGMEWGILMAARRYLTQTPMRRKEIARTAARARWGRS